MKIVEVEMKHANSMVKGERKPREINPDDLKWEVDTIDPSRMIALVYGNPTKPGPYTVRLRAKPGYNISLHEHFAEDELLTVISGSLYWSTGEEGSNAQEHKINAGGVVLFPANTPHRIWTVEQTEIQMTGIGPREYFFINPPEET